jgi:hypothetical protein
MSKLRFDDNSNSGQSGAGYSALVPDWTRFVAEMLPSDSLHHDIADIAYGVVPFWDASHCRNHVLFSHTVKIRSKITVASERVITSNIALCRSLKARWLITDESVC